ncbi:MAG: hypothetical protein A3E07_01120 [Candidatus Wildermuthbacteria bacterium RIFCSPHIGHO2_12_FULL_45_9]|uniref:Toxin HicA n=1 Tax=Candidatus Wildermuthbacteria bacterium RIFCSPHIGHO2_02_FULL_45_25 TaxID=1802450 RepID=A0A1G2QZ25_9BACT|nr:MAG: hypothetical protein A2748_02065 [Candidatus Wildermuthbacteria bacterium RIFCSPHIGHO2_01_FULL_45_20]OHA65707.1 MAG: hypothetical protein A3C04_02210 [Candidatus Wildermuthbacteria bacterium RIFCSPHIGHO2_02_FULL_45_25]OHA70262.1 MAG: hypothetical protein A3E07_01120 [Candidatus Wildermuthbacteria bacterium RIFCSPHIGHO2_12_FULL_45_9]
MRFLKEYGFQYTHSRGSHFYYAGAYKGKFHQVTIPLHHGRSLKPRTLKGIIAQSGIPKEEWLEK